MDSSNKTEEYRYVAFISYKSDDSRWAKWLQGRLERYRLPTEIREKLSTKKEKLGRCFIYQHDILPNVLRTELQRNLKASQWLIVICSKNAVHSPWVSEEIDTFVSLGRKDRIVPFIIGGTPYSSDHEEECLPEALRRHFPRTGDPHTTGEFLGANVTEESGCFKFIRKERALIQTISLVLGVEFDTLWQRHKRYLRLLICYAFAVLAVFLAILGFTWYSNQPFDATLRVMAPEMAATLDPLNDITVTVDVSDDDIRQFTLPDTQHVLTVSNLPARVKGEAVRIRANHDDCMATDTLISASETMTIHIHRNPDRFGHVDILLAYNADHLLKNKKVMIEGIPAMTDSNGRLKADIPLSRQKKSYTLSCDGSEYQISMPHRSIDVLIIDR